MVCEVCTRDHTEVEIRVLDYRRFQRASEPCPNCHLVCREKAASTPGREEAASVHPVTSDVELAI